jgi:citrate synthase
LATGAGQNGGAREAALFMERWQAFGTETGRWLDWLQTGQVPRPVDVWPELEHPPGFDPNGVRCATPVLQALRYLAGLEEAGPLTWLLDHRDTLEASAELPLSMVAVAATALCSCGFDPRAGEMLFLLLRLPGAAAHALEQERYGWRRFPLFREAIELVDPDTAELPLRGLAAVGRAA